MSNFLGSLHFAAVFFRQALHNQGKRQTDAYKKRNTGFTKAGHV